jgi:hypothetical protein
MVTRTELLEHLDRLSDAGHPPACWRVPIADRGLWTSEDASQRAVAARICTTCPALTPCASYGVANPDEAGVIGGLSEAQRRRDADTTKEHTNV